MARRARTTSQPSTTDQSVTEPSTTDQSVTEPTSEDTVSTSTVTDEAPASAEQADTASTEQASTGSTNGKAKPEIDLSDFEAAVATAVEERDTTTGLLPLAAIEPVVKEYRALDGLAPKNAAKKRLQHLMTEVMNNLDLPQARAYLELLNNLTPASSGGGTERVAADPTEAFTQRVAGLRLSLLLAEANVPEGVNDSWEEKVDDLLADAEGPANEYRTWLNADSESRGEAPEVPSWVAGAVKLSQGRSGKVGGSTKSGGGSAFNGERRDVAKHILSAFENVESGTFLSIAEIKKTPSDEYGTDSPSAGAISARLFPKSGKTTVEGIRPGEKDNRKGAFKL